MKRRKQLTYEERLQIEQALNERMSFSQIANQLSHPTGTISKEVQRNSEMKAANLYGRKSFHLCVQDDYCLERLVSVSC